MNKLLIASTLATGALLMSVSPSVAAVSCVTQYGTIVPYTPGQVCVRTGEIQINKEVFDPQAKKFVDNLGASAYQFAPGEEVTFRLRIKNIGDNTLDTVQVTDTLPAILEPISSAFTFEIKDLEVDQTVEKELKARFVPVNKLGNEQTCEENRAEVKSGDKQDSDTAMVCVEKKKVAELPKAGATDTFALIFSSLTSGFVGLRFLKAKRN